MKRYLTSLIFPEMQLKPTVRYPYMPTRIKLKRLTILSIIEDNQLENWFMIWEHNIVQPTLESSMAPTYHTTQWVHSQRATQWKKHSSIQMLVGNVHSRFTHKWLELETAQVFVNWQMNKKITEFYAILLSNEKEQNIDTHNHMDKSQKHCAKCKKQSIKDYILYDSTYTKL